MKQWSKVARVAYAAVVAGFIFWQVTIWGGFTFAAAGKINWAIQVFIFLAFWLDIPLALASIVWPRFGLIAIPANIAVTSTYMVSASLVEHFHHVRVGWPGTGPLLLLFAPKLLLVGLLALVVHFDRRARMPSVQESV